MNKFCTFFNIQNLFATAALCVVATAADASTLKPRDVSAGTCSISQMGGSTQCDGAFFGGGGFGGNDNNTDLDGLFGLNGWTEITKVDASSGTSGILTTTAATNELTGTWSANLSGFGNVMAVLKAGNGFSAYLMNTSAIGGNWNTEALSVFNNAGKETTSGLSHFTLYQQGTIPSVPLPASSLLLIAGLAGFGALRRRRHS